MTIANYNELQARIVATGEVAEAMLDGSYLRQRDFPLLGHYLRTFCEPGTTKAETHEICTDAVKLATAAVKTARRLHSAGAV